MKTQQLTLLNPSSTKVIAGTGHRLNKLKSDKLTTRRLTDLAIWYFKLEKPNQVISGMALGWDTAIAIAAIKLDIPVVAAIPFINQDKLWTPQDRLLYKRLLTYCKDVVVVCDGDYAAYKLMTRNKYMVDRCTQVVALYDGVSAGGTANCIKYAVSKNVPIDNLWNAMKKIQFGY